MNDALWEIQERTHQRNARRAFRNLTYLPDIPEAAEGKKLLWQELRKNMVKLEEEVLKMVKWRRLQCQQERRLKGETEEKLQHGYNGKIIHHYKCWFLNLC